MEILFLILLVAVFALWVSNQGLKARVQILEQRLEGPEAPPVREPPARFAREEWETVVERELAEPASSAEAEAEPETAAEPDWPPPEEVAEDGERETLGGLFERLVAGRLLIWVGGIALVAAAIFLIRYSIELVTPEARMIAAAAFGFLLLGFGEYARNWRRLADEPRIAQVLVGAGLAVLYAATYGSYVLYALIGPAVASGLMLGVTLAALLLSLRQGAPTAVMGLAGGFLTPLLVGDPDAGAIPLLAYLALLDLALFLIAWRRGWTWLAAAAVALSFVWSGYLLVQPPEDALAAGAFVVLLALAATLVRPGRGRALGLIQPLAIGLVQLAVLVARVDLGLPAWGLFAILAAASLGLAAFRREYRLAPPLAAALALGLLAAKALTGEEPLVPIAAAGATLLFGFGGLALAAWRGGALSTALAAAGFAGPTLILRAARPELLERPAWGALLLALATGPAALVWLNRRRASAEPPADLTLLAAGAAAAVLFGAAAWDLLPPMLAAAGWLAAALAVALAARRLGDLALATVAAAAAAAAVARALWTVPELSVATITALLGIPVLAPDLPTALEALQALALPALLLAALRLALPPLPLGARRALPVAAALLAAAALYVGFRQAFGLADHSNFVARGLLERTILTQALFAAGWWLGSGRRVPGLEPGLAHSLGTLFTALAAARLIWFDILVHNPAWADQWVGTLPALNLIAPQYLLGAIWLYLARRRADRATRSGFWLAAFLAALIAGTALLVRQGFQGPILTGPEMPTAEFYAYSLAGILVSLGLLLAGIRLPDKALRLSGLLLLTATILKVFLADASALEGIWRILSFLGLGAALILIGRLYGPVLRAGNR